MLKFSGFADLTSCLGRKGPKDLEKEKPPRADNGEAHEMLTWLLAKEFPYTLNASKAPRST
jgi:hypothetical protein